MATRSGRIAPARRCRGRVRGRHRRHRGHCHCCKTYKAKRSKIRWRPRRRAHQIQRHQIEPEDTAAPADFIRACCCSAYVAHGSLRRAAADCCRAAADSSRYERPAHVAGYTVHFGASCLFIFPESRHTYRRSVRMFGCPICSGGPGHSPILIPYYPTVCDRRRSEVMLICWLVKAQCIGYFLRLCAGLVNHVREARPLRIWVPLSALPNSLHKWSKRIAVRCWSLR